MNVIGRRKSEAKEPTLVEVAGKTREKTLHFDGHFDVVPIGGELFLLLVLSPRS